MNKKAKNRKTNVLAKSRNGVIFPVADKIATMPADYPGFMKELKTRIRQERTKAVLAANSALVLMYWDIGNSILAKQRKSGWGTKVIDRMSADLKEEFPDMSGFSPRNLKYMRKFAEAWPDNAIVQRTVAQIK
ncbi:MAG: DUF1016 N-terminal domain-containing protein [Victivallaceae bacterium]|nr:DUF1016 N-terminal domain-containing protein [Victivallaceae bacterium]